MKFLIVVFRTFKHLFQLLADFCYAVSEALEVINNYFEPHEEKK